MEITPSTIELACTNPAIIGIGLLLLLFWIVIKKQANQGDRHLAAGHKLKAVGTAGEMILAFAAFVIALIILLANAGPSPFVK